MTKELEKALNLAIFQNDILVLNDKEMQSRNRLLATRKDIMFSIKLSKADYTIYNAVACKVRGLLGKKHLNMKDDI